MSRIPDSPTTTKTNVRLARQASHDVLRTRHQLRLPTSMTVSKSTTRIQPSRSRMSDSSADDELTLIDTPTTHYNIVPRFSVSSTTSSIQTTLSTPRSSLPSVHEQEISLWIGQRVSVDSIKLKGTLRFLGTTQFKSGVWAGIELDQPGAGKNDGSVDSIRYFTCPPKTGIFVLSTKVTCCRTQQQQRSNPTSPSSPKLRKKKTLAKQTSLPCINTNQQQSNPPPPLPTTSSQHQQRPRHPLSVSPKTSGIPSPEITPTTTIPLDSTSTPVMHQVVADPIDKFHHHISNNTIMADSHDDEGERGGFHSKKEINLAAAHPYSSSIKECHQCKEHEHVRTDLETKLAEMTLALNSNTGITLSYKHRVKELEQTVEELKRAGMETIDLYESATQKHDQDLKRHTAKLAQAYTRIQTLENERDRLKLAKEDAETVLSEYTQVERTQLIQEHTEKEQKSQHKIEQLEKSIHEEKHENEQLRHQVAQLVKELDHEKTDHEHCKKECTSLQETLQVSQTEYQLLQDRIKALPPTPMGLASIPEQQLQAQLNDTKLLLEKMRQERVLETEQHRRHITTLNRDIAELESLIEAKIFKEADLLEALDNERKAVHRLLTEHQGSIAGRRRKMTTTTSIRSIASSTTTCSLNSSLTRKSSTAPSFASTSTSHTSAPPPPPRLPPPSIAVPPVPFHTLSRSASLLEQHLDDETPYCEVCQVSGHDLMGCSSVLDQIPPIVSSQFSSCRQPRISENKAF